MDISQHLRGTFLKADDITAPTRTMIVTTRMVNLQGEQRVIMDTDYGSIVMNKTNLTAISGAYGVNTDQWVGRTIELRREQTTFQGRAIACIRCYPPAPMARETRPAPAPRDLPF